VLGSLLPDQEAAFHQPVEFLLDQGQTLVDILHSRAFFLEVTDEESEFLEDLVGGERPEKESV
jgi:hypothetical protein